MRRSFMCLLESLLDDAPVDLLGKPIADSDARVLDVRGREKKPQDASRIGFSRDSRGLRESSRRSPGRSPFAFLAPRSPDSLTRVRYMDPVATARVRCFNRTVTQRIGALSEEYLACGRPLGASRVLWEIGEGDLGVRELRARLDLDSGYLSRLLRRLEGDGLIEVEHSPHDRRVRIARLTDAGRVEKGSCSTVAAMSSRGRWWDRSTTTSEHVWWRRWALSSGSSRPASWTSGSRSRPAPQYGRASTRTSLSSTRALRLGSIPAAASRPTPASSASLKG